MIDDIARRIEALHPRLIDLSLDRLRRLLRQLGSPERRLPPVLHVAGTNGKGSTCAFLRAMAEAAGSRVHVYTSPHLVRFNERIRVAGRLVDDERLRATLEHVERVNDKQPITVFEVITAAAFVLFAETPADLCVLEVGLGGRGDATNVIEAPAASGITSISLDHRDLLGPTIEDIAAEKAGIMRAGVPMVTGTQPASVQMVLRGHAAAAGAVLLMRGRDWQIEPTATGIRLTDDSGAVEAPRPSLPGAWQLDNAGIALRLMRAASLPHAPEGLAQAAWPARMQRLTGRLAGMLPDGWSLWLDGGHNPGAGQALAEHVQGWRDQPLHLIIGMKQSKDAGEFLRPLLPLAATVWAVQEPGQYQALSIEAIIEASGGVARLGGSVTEALSRLPRSEPARVLICGSLYLAGEVLTLDGGCGD